MDGSRPARQSFPFKGHAVCLLLKVELLTKRTLVICSSEFIAQPRACPSSTEIRSLKFQFLNSTS